MIVARAAEELQPAERSVAIGTFDGVHLGHRAVIEAMRESGLRSTVVTFDPHPREVLGYGVQLLSTLERKLELIASIGPDETLLLEFTLELSLLPPEEFVRATLEPIGTKIVIAGEDFRFGHARSGDVELLRGMGFEVQPVPIVPGVSSSRPERLRICSSVTLIGTSRTSSAWVGRVTARRAWSTRVLPKALDFRRLARSSR